MTRFTRAKGSKASNERVPDEATPWSEMKMQLEDSQAASKPVTKKPKTAKELLAEKDEIFYHDTTGNVNHEWAAFDDVPEFKSRKKNIGKLSDIKGGKKYKKELERLAKFQLLNDHSTSDETPPVPVKITNKKHSNVQAAAELESKSTKKRIHVANGVETETDSKKFDVTKSSDEKNVNNAVVNLNSDHVLPESKSDSTLAENLGSKRKKRNKKSKKEKSGEDIGQVVTDHSREGQKPMLTDGDCGAKESTTKTKVEGDTEKLSKRQKRNQKKQRKIISEKNESQSQAAAQGSEKKQNFEGFDVQGNDWSNQVKFGKQVNSRTAGLVASNDDNQFDKITDLGKKKEKFSKKKVNLEAQANSADTQVENLISDQSKSPQNNDAQNQKTQKRKAGKNEKKEYKRRKPDEGVVKMIFNGNEVEVVKYDGFPVKKEDADRLEELKKNMIIKGRTV